MSRSPERIILICEECGEKLVLADTVELWISEPTDGFECQCGKGLYPGD